MPQEGTKDSLVQFHNVNYSLPTAANIISDLNLTVERGETLVLLGESGHLAALRIDPGAPQVVSLSDEPVIDGPCYTAPALAGGLLYLRAERTLLCLSLRR